MEQEITRVHDLLDSIDKFLDARKNMGTAQHMATVRELKAECQDIHVHATIKSHHTQEFESSWESLSKAQNLIMQMLTA